MTAEEYLADLKGISHKMDKAIRLKDLIFKRMDELRAQRRYVDIDENFKDDADEAIVAMNELAIAHNQVIYQKRERLWEHFRKVEAIANQYTERAFAPIREKTRECGNRGNPITV